jgi:hypothetical protein
MKYKALIRRVVAFLLAAFFVFSTPGGGGDGICGRH